MSPPDLEAEARRSVKLFVEATHEFQNRLATSGNDLASEWGPHMREALTYLEQLGVLLARIYAASPGDAAKARKEFVEYGLNDFATHWYRHIDRLNDLVDTKYPEPQEDE